MQGKEGGARAEARFVARGVIEPTKPRRVLTWRNPFRHAAIAAQPGCPLRVLDPKFYSHASLGSRIATTLRFDLRNVGGKAIHSYFWRHASPVERANGGFGCQPEGGLSPGASQREMSHLTWRGPLTITIDFVQFSDGTVWLTSDPRSSIKQPGLDAGVRAAAEHLLRVWREGGMEGLTAALPRIHLDVQDPAWSSERHDRFGAFGFYAGVTRASVVVSAISGERVEERLEALFG